MRLRDVIDGRGRMMREVMVELLVESSVLIILILALRTIFSGRIRYCILYGLWGLVALRLLLPIPLLQTSVNVMQVWNEASAMLQHQSVKWDDKGGEVGQGQSEKQIRSDRQEQNALDQQDSTMSAEEETSSDDVQGIEDGKSSVSKNQTEPSKRVWEREGVLEEGNQTEGGLSKVLCRLQDIGLKRIVSAVWMAGMMICLLVLMSANFNLYRKLYKDRKLYTERRLSMVRGMYEGCKNGQHLRVYTTSVLSSPCLYGFVRPAIYLPEDLVDEISDTNLGQVVAHEQMHYCHRDHIWSVLRMLLVSLYWYDPLVWLAALVAKRDAEFACDESVVRELGESQRHQYAVMLLEVAEYRQLSHLFCSITAMSRQGKQLEQRIRALGSTKRIRPVYLLPFIAVVLCVAVITFTGGGNNDELSQKKDMRAEARQIGKKAESMAENIVGGTAKAGKTSASDTSSLQLSDEMTMEELTRLCAEGRIGQVTSEQFMSYRNAQRTEESADDLSYHIVYDDLTFPDREDDDLYRLSVDVDKSSESIERIYIEQLDTDRDDMLTESAILYVGEEYQETASYVKSIAEFLDHDDVLDKTIHYVLPEGLQNGRCVYGLGGTSNDPGRLFMTEKQERKNGVYGYQHTLVWSADGGMMQMELGTDADGLLHMPLSDYNGNGKGAAIGVKQIEGRKGALTAVNVANGIASVEAVQIQPEAYLGDLCWYHPEGYRSKKHYITKLEVKSKSAELLPRKLWIGCIQPENSSLNTQGEGMGYVFFLDQDKYSKQDMIDLLLSVNVQIQ